MVPQPHPQPRAVPGRSSRRRSSAPIALLALEFFDGKLSGYVGLIFGVFAAPGLLVVGVPFSGDEVYPIGITLSVLLWLIVGAVAARRATRNPMAVVGRLLARRSGGSPAASGSAASPPSSSPGSAFGDALVA